MTDQQPSLREAFINERRTAADQYLSALAERLASDIEQKKGEVGEEWVSSRSSGGYKSQPTMSFSDPALEKITVGEVLKMEGYKKLNKVCARLDVDMCLGRPSFHSMPHDPFKKVVIFVELPYSDSEDAAAKRKEAAAQRPAPKKRKLRDVLLRRHRHSG